MGEHIHLQFRPSLIIFVGKAGGLIHDQFFGPKKLLANLDQPLRQSVGLLRMKTPDEDQYVDNEIEPLPSEVVFPDDDEDMPQASGKIADIIYRTLASVQLDRRRLVISSAGYSVPNPRTQIFIIGDLAEKNALFMAEVLRTVREKVRLNNFETPVCYFLNSYGPPQPQNYASGLKKNLDDPLKPLKWFDYEIANLCFLFEHMITHPFPVFMSENEVRYATAEALLALTATGISSSIAYEEEMNLPMQLEDYGQRVGSMSTSMIRFPRVEAQEYCSALLSSDLMKKWQEDLYRGHISDGDRKDLITSARGAANTIEDWIKDSKIRPLTEDSYCPSLDILRQKNQPMSDGEYARQIETHRRQVEYMRDLFAIFFYDAVHEEYRSQKHKVDSWSDIAYKRFGKAVDRYVRWEAEARKAWEAASNKVGEDVKYKVDALWTKSDNGFEIARIYVVELDNTLSRLADSVTQWRQEHDAAFRDKRSQFEQIAGEREEWQLDDDDPNIIGTNLGQGGQAKPTMGGQGPVIGASSTSGIIGGSSGGNTSVIINASPPNPGPQHLPVLEERIALNLGRRALWKQDQVPTLLVLVAVSFSGWLIAALTLGLFNMVPALLYTLNATLAGLTILGALAIRYQRQRQVTTARQDILAFYRSYYIYSCERREDLQRINLMKALRGRVTRMRERLEDMSTFLANVSDQSQKDAKQANDQLFNGPAGIRDIFIANGERLQRHGKHTLNDVARQVTQLRVNHPLAEWHRTLDDMKDELIKTFRTAPVSLIEMTQDGARDYINDFTASIVSSYLVGSLVSISAALDKPEIWREVLDRVRKPLYFAGVGIREPRLLFVCGNSRDIGKSTQYIPSEAITVETKSPEWLIIVAFFRGGEPTVLNTDNLFLPKTVPPPGGTPPGSPSSAAGPQSPSSLGSTTGGTPPGSLGSATRPQSPDPDDDDDDTTRPRRR